MKTFQDLVTEGLAIASPKVYKHFTAPSGYLDITPKRPRYDVTSIKSVVRLNKTDIKSTSLTFKKKDRYFIVGGTKTPYSNIKAYIQMNEGKITKDADKADHFVIDNSVFESYVYFENAIRCTGPNDTILITSDLKYPSWNQFVDLLVDNNVINEYPTWNFTTQNVYDDNALVALAVVKNYPNKLVTPYDLGIASGSITELTDDNIKAVCRMISSRNDEDTKLANHMISTFDYKASHLMTWKFCKELYNGGKIWYLNRRMKAVREFISDVCDKYGHLNETEFFEFCRRNKCLTPEIFAYLHKSLQDRVRVLHNPDIWTVKFEMKEPYKKLLKEHHNAEN